MADRRVKVTLASDVSEYTADLARAAAQTRGLGDESRKTRNETKGVGDESTKASIALRKLSDAAGAAQVAQLRLNEAREKGKTSGASMLALTQRLERAQRDLADAQQAATKATGDHNAVQRTLAESMARTVRAAAVQAEIEKSGEDSGGRLAKGINQGLTRNSPLIVAGISGALAAGAPVAIAGAAALFGGIGIAAAAQNDEVKRAWSNTWKTILTDTQADASVLQKTVAGMATQVGLAFQEMRPEIQQAFVALAPILHDFTDSLLQAAQNALPGIVTAIQNAGPVMDGLGSAIEAIGTGLGQFFQILSQHAGTAGTAIKAIGDIIGALLPILGDLLGAGADLASHILPPLASALQTVADVLDKIAPVLPGVIAGFLGFKAISALDGPLLNLATRLGKVTEDGTKAVGTLGRLSGALPLIGLATAGLTVALQDSAEQQDKVTSGLEQLYRTVQIGGPQAAQAQQLLNDAAKNGSSSFLGLGADVHDALGQAKASTDAWWASLSPLQQANEVLTQRTTELNTAIEQHGVNSTQATLAANNFRSAQADVQHQEDLTKGAVDGVTQAMINQYNEALAATNSSFAYRDAQNQVADAQTNLTDVQSHLHDANEATRTSTDDVQRAGLALEEALYRQAEAAGKLASDSLPATATELEHNTAAAQGTLQELYKMRDQMGSAFPASLQQTIANLEQTGVHLDTTTGQAQQLANTVNGVPTMHSIHVDADLGSAQAKMDGFINKHWQAIISTNVAGSGSGGGLGGKVKLAAGGPVRGPGTATSDSVPALLSNDEHVLTAREVQAAGGHNAVIAWRKALVRRFADGGPVSKDWTKVFVDADMSGANAGITAAQKAAGALAGGNFGGGGSGGYRDLGRQIAAAMGYAAQFGAIDYIFTRESGWNPRAQNPTSTAYGIPQFLNSTWAAYGGKTNDPGTQIRDGISYMRDRYGSPNGAAAFWQAHHWYANGGVIGEPVAGIGLASGDRYMFGENGPETVTPMSREMSGGVGGRGTIAVAPPIVKVYLDGQEWRGMARVEAEGVVVDAFSGATTRARNNPR